METINKEIEHIEKWLSYLEVTQHARLNETIKNIDADFDIIKDHSEKDELPLFKDMVTLFNEIKGELKSAIKKEKEDVFKKIKETIRNIDYESAEEAYLMLSTPVRKIIMKHHTILDKIHNLLPMVTSLGYKGLTHDQHLNAYTDLFDLYNSYNKLIYIEENMLFPALVSVFENKND